MAWWNDNPFSRAGNKRTHEIELKSVIGQTGDSIRQFLVFGAQANAGTPSAALDLYESSTAVSIPVNKFAEKFADLTPVI